MQNAPSHSLLSLISAILGDKPPDEVPMVSSGASYLLVFIQINCFYMLGTNLVVLHGSTNVP